MSLDLDRRVRAIESLLEHLRKADVAGNYLPWSQRVLNPFPLASSGNVWGETPQPWEVSVLALYVSVFVNTTNNGTNFWTLDLITEPGGTTLASVSTAAASANTWTRLVDLSVTTPGSTNVALAIRPTATLSPGSIFIVPSLAVLKVGNG